MTGKVLNIEEFLVPDQLACKISEQYVDWELRRNEKVREWEEVSRYVYATDTTKTTNSKLPWSNKTTLPKLCQIRDNLYANYMATLFPKRKWLIWEGDKQVDEEKKKAIEAYMGWTIDRNEFYDEVSKFLLDYIDYGNAFVTVEWADGRSFVEGENEKVGYVGPVIRRISPLEIVFNPTAPNFASAPKIIRSIVSLGEVKEMLERTSLDDNAREDAKKLYEYMKDLRHHLATTAENVQAKDAIYQISGFDSYQAYLGTNNVEVLTFYGDIYDEGKDEFKRNQIIKVVDRHKILSQNANPSYFGTAPIYHAGWRIRPDNLWAMGPLDNLVGMQYRIDHLENMKADVFDLIAYPPQKIRGYVEDYNWGPFEKIYVGDDGDVELLSPDVAALQADNQIALLEMKMEEMAGSPKEAMGFRTPGEKTKYEVQRLENAASRIFQSKTGQIERQLVEPALNALLELARRQIDKVTIRIFDNDLKINIFKDLTPEEITGNGRLKPIAARHFAEKAQQVQDLNNFTASPAYADQAVSVHFSSVKLAKMWESLLDLEEFEIVQPFIRLSEQSDMQRFAQVQEEQVAIDTTTPSGIMPGDFDTPGPMNDQAIQ